MNLLRFQVLNTNLTIKIFIFSYNKKVFAGKNLSYVGLVSYMCSLEQLKLHIYCTYLHTYICAYMCVLDWGKSICRFVWDYWWWNLKFQQWVVLAVMYTFKYSVASTSYSYNVWSLELWFTYLWEHTYACIYMA